MASTPDNVRFGRVVWSAQRVLADGTDTDPAPDVTPITGFVRLSARVPVVRWQGGAPFTGFNEPLVCRVVAGTLRPPDGFGDTPGVTVISSVQPDADVAHVQWEATFDLDNVATQPPPVIFEVPDGGTVDLSTITPQTPTPGTVQVVTTEVRDAALDAAARAEAAASAAAANAVGAVDAAVARAEAARDATEAAVVDGGDWSGNVTVDAATGPVVVHARLTGDTAVHLPDGGDRAYTVTLVLTQGPTGGYSVRVPGAVTSFGIAPALTGVVGGVDVLHGMWDGHRWWVLVGAVAGVVPAGWAA